MASIEDLKVGDRIWFVFNNKYSDNRYLTIHKLGRQYMYVGQPDYMWNTTKVDRKTLKAYDKRTGEYEGRAYLSPEEHEKRVRMEAKWEHLQRWVCRINRLPEGIGEMDINMLSGLLEKAGYIPDGNK